jgi:hypothetical protein
MAKDLFMGLQQNSKKIQTSKTTFFSMSTSTAIQEKASELPIKQAGVVLLLKYFFS